MRHGLLLQEPAAREGCRDAEMLDALRPRVVKMAAWLAHRTGMDVDDLSQEAMVAMFEMLPRLDYSIGVPEQHLLKRARWRMMDAVRRSYRRRAQRLPEIEPVEEPWHDVHSNVDIGLLQERLSLVQRRILRALLEGYTWREAGEMVGCTSANVGYHVRRIQAAWRELERLN